MPGEVDRNRRTRRLLIGAVVFLVGTPVSAVLHNLLDGVSVRVADLAILAGVLEFLSVVFFVAAVVVFPAAVVICLIAALMDRLTRGWKPVPRRVALFLVPILAAFAAITYVESFLSISKRVTDETAGFNGSFEVVESGYPVNWYVYHRPLNAGEAEISFDSAAPIDGNQSLKILAERVDRTGTGRRPGLFQVTDAQPGDAYRVSFWLKNQGAQVRLLIDSRSGDSRQPRSPVRESIDAEATGDDVWREFVYSYTVPEHYSNIRFELKVTAPGTVWVDDVRIERQSGE